MGTHISRVKSVDLDAWTDEQLQSVVKWGNARANKCVERPCGLQNKVGMDYADLTGSVYRYWEAKLAPGHIPSEA